MTCERGIMIIVQGFFRNHKHTPCVALPYSTQMDLWKTVWTVQLGSWLQGEWFSSRPCLGGFGKLTNPLRHADAEEVHLKGLAANRAPIALLSEQTANCQSTNQMSMMLGRLPRPFRKLRCLIHLSLFSLSLSLYLYLSGVQRSASPHAKQAH